MIVQRRLKCSFRLQKLFFCMYVCSVHAGMHLCLHLDGLVCVCVGLLLILSVFLDSFPFYWGRASHRTQRLAMLASLACHEDIWLPLGARTAGSHFVSLVLRESRGLKRGNSTSSGGEGFSQWACFNNSLSYCPLTYLVPSRDHQNDSLEGTCSYFLGFTF